MEGSKFSLLLKTVMGLREKSRLFLGGRLLLMSILMGVKDMVEDPVVSSMVVTEAFLVLRRCSFHLAALLMCWSSTGKLLHDLPPQ